MGSKEPIRLLMKDDAARYRMTELAYHDGLRYPPLERVGKGSSGLDLLLSERSTP
jgi:hypothetical protein